MQSNTRIINLSVFWGLSFGVFWLGNELHKFGKLGEMLLRNNCEWRWVCLIMPFFSARTVKKWKSASRFNILMVGCPVNDLWRIYASALLFHHASFATTILQINGLDFATSGAKHELSTTSGRTRKEIFRVLGCIHWNTKELLLHTPLHKEASLFFSAKKIRLDSFSLFP